MLSPPASSFLFTKSFRVLLTALTIIHEVLGAFALRIILMLRFNDLTKSSGENIMGFCGYLVDIIGGAGLWILLTHYNLRPVLVSA